MSNTRNPESGFEMNDFDTFVKDQLAREGVAREYHRLAPFYRLADQLLLLRKKRGLSQQDLAAKAQTTQAVVSRLENVSVRCSLETVVRLAEALEAVVEVRLIPTEELNQPELPSQVSAADEECDEASEKEAQRGVVFFGKASKKPCQSQVWYRVDPQTQRVLPAKESRKQRTLEIA
jgi:transcriptional regulator with XRE-family HTH domain